MNTSLPANFLWGNSVSSMQTEGAWNEGGKGMSVYDIREAGENISDWKVATDSYHRYREDFDLISRKMGRWEEGAWNGEQRNWLKEPCD